MLRLILIISLILWAEITNAAPKEKLLCFYQSSSGEIKQASSLDDVPYSSRKFARCQPIAQNSYLARPEEIKLDGNTRAESFGSSVGTISLRWPRKVESLFGRTPLRAMTDAANTLGRSLKNAAFPARVQNLSLNWNVVFMDESMPEGQIPTNLVSNCHPGWMTPPANIYIVAQRVAGGCGSARSSSSVADSTLAQVLIHEMGHAVEFYMLDKNNQLDRVRAEGFATWFERYASEYSSILDARQISRNHFQAARAALAKNPGPFSFQGTFEDYSRASLYFSAITSPRGLQGLVDVYEYMNSTGNSLIPSITKELNWDERRIAKELEQVLVN